MIKKWIVWVFGRNGNGVDECEPEPVTKKNVGQHSKRITLEMRRIDREFGEALKGEIAAE